MSSAPHPRWATADMWDAATKAPRGTTFMVMRRAHGTEAWRQIALFHELHKAAESIDEAVASGEGELDEYRIDSIHPPVRRRWWRPSTWR